jgi:hypothetical protein
MALACPALFAISNLAIYTNYLLPGSSPGNADPEALPPSRRGKASRSGFQGRALKPVKYHQK